MKIAICEDNLKESKQLQEMIQKSLKKQEVEAELCVFENAEELLESAEKTYYAIFFLDVMLPDMSGIEAAKQIRRDGSHSPIVFATTSKDYLVQSYSVWAVHYLVKPLKQKDIDEAIERSLTVLSGEQKMLKVTLNRYPEEIPYEDIFYVEGDGRNCNIHTRTGVFSPYITVQDMLGKLDDNRFYLPHRSYIINLDHVIAIQREKIAMRDDRFVPIRRGGTEEVQEIYEKYRFEKVREL